VKKSLSEKTIGIDLGIKDLATLSNGIKFENPKFLEKSYKKLAVHQRRLSYYLTKKQKEEREKKLKITKENSLNEEKIIKKRFYLKHLRKQKKYKKIFKSNRYEKQRIRIAKIHRKIVNQRLNYIHNFSKHIIDDYDSIMVEDLSIKSMMQNHQLARSLSSLSAYEIRRQLEYKSDLYGKNVIVVPAYNTSKTCSSCGYVKENLQLEDREWTCPECGKTHDRDINAAINIKKAGFNREILQKYWSQYFYEYKNTPRSSGEEYVESRILVRAMKRKDGVLLFK
jgi:putative transposase